MASRPPRITSTRRQPTTRGGPRVTSRSRQPTTPLRINMNALGVRRLLSQANRASGATPAAPAVPAAAAAAQYSLSNLPPDATYEAADILLQRQRQEGLAAIAGERTRTLSDYGFQEGPSGALTFDPNNPFSKAALLKKAYDTNRRSTAQSMGAGGQLYAGAFQNAQDLVNRNQLQAQDAQLKQLQSFIAQNDARRTQAQTDYEIAAGQAYGDRVGRFQDNPLYDPATGALLPAGGNGGAAAATPAAAAAAQASELARIAAGLRRRARTTGLSGRRI